MWASLWGVSATEGLPRHIRAPSAAVCGTLFGRKEEPGQRQLLPAKMPEPQPPPQRRSASPETEDLPRESDQKLLEPAERAGGTETGWEQDRSTQQSTAAVGAGPRVSPEAVDDTPATAHLAATCWHVGQSAQANAES